MKKTLSIVVGIAICLLVGFVSSLVMADSLAVWYPVIEKSSLTPPGIVFPIMWGILYVLMGISAGIIFSADDVVSKKRLLGLFALQLVLNFTWNVFFFYLQNPMSGLVNLLLLDVLAVVFFLLTLREKRSAAWVFFPYSIWLLFATYLNLYVFLYN